MRTEIERRYRSGFLLSEQELRRIAQSGQEHFSKLGETGSLKIQAKLRDGSLILSDSLDEIFLVENSGQKAVTKLLLEWQGDQEPRKASLRVEFQDGVKNTKGWDSVSLSVMGDSRDAVFVAASDLEERIKKTRIRSWPSSSTGHGS